MNTLFAGVAAARVQDDALRAFEAALAAGAARHVRDVRFADQLVRLELAGDDALATFTPSFAPAAPAGPGETRDPDLTLRVWDATTTPSAYLPSPAPQVTECLEPGSYYQDPRVAGRAATGELVDGHPRYQVFWEPFWVFGFDLAAKTGFFHCPIAREVPDWSLAHPFFKLLHPWLRARGVTLAHAGAVGVGDRGVMIAGPSGAGKSTLSIAARLAGLEYLGDDFVAFRLAPSPRAFGLYRMAKLVPEHMRAMLPAVEERRHAHRAALPKAHLVLDVTRPAGLAVVAIVAPQVTGAARSELAPIGAAEALNALAPSTLFQLPGYPSELGRLAALVRSAPAYRLPLGPDLDGAVAALRALLATDAA